MTILSAYLIIAAILYIKRADQLLSDKIEADQYFEGGGEIRHMPKPVMRNGLYKFSMRFVYFVWCFIGLFGNLWVIFLLSIASQDFIAKKVPIKYSIQAWLIQVMIYATLYIAITDGWITTPEIRIFESWHNL